MREYKRFQHKYYGDNKYQRKTKDKHGREVVKPIDVKDYEEMVRLCLVHRDQAKTDKEYYRWYRNYVILTVGVNTGNRITTIIEQIPRDYAGGKYTVTEHKTRKRQQYTLNPDVYSIVKKYIDEFDIGMNQFMFMSKFGSRQAITREGVWKMITNLAKEANIEYPVGCHSLRKSYGRWKWDETHDLLLVQSLLMHDSAEETMRYICLEANEIDEARTQIAYIPRYE
ncbi:MAG: tyrosine-type recombinase/integrase [Solobacterium sp.]|nr:tyrosine-type recombinase/integrase [Solobacterium sp.]